MTKVYPNSAAVESQISAGAGLPAALTVWRKSLLFNCSGFTVFNADGDLAFRVDNYSGSRGEVVLMDAAGKPLLTVRRKKMSLGDQWLVFEGEEVANARFSVRKQPLPLQVDSARNTVRGADGRNGYCSSAYEIEGSYAQRSCRVYGGEGRRELVAEVQRKETAAKGVVFRADVFRLGMQPGLDVTFAMAMVVVLEQMFGSG